ncbi:MAG: hypothetical protein HLUCCX14_07535 [Marinobacter excellens HL-55]|uniref:Uncharacterized protein n=1 Tax=Marinobacter excellens HL-55 TaxID=1305731 RepID=A0A0P8D039_9GAMM|nr:MAG: hypothetical protein HLUCCX14_07535 [Marinobacter excellens HL-55]
MGSYQIRVASVQSIAPCALIPIKPFPEVDIVQVETVVSRPEPTFVVNELINIIARVANEIDILSFTNFTVGMELH